MTDRDIETEKLIAMTLHAVRPDDGGLIGILIENGIAEVVKEKEADNEPNDPEY